METQNTQDDKHSQTGNPDPPNPATQTPPVQSQVKSSQITTGLIILIVFLVFLMLMLSLNGKFSLAGAGPQNLTALQAHNEQLRAEANAQRARLGLPPLPPSSTSAYAAAERLRNDAHALASLASSWETELETKNATIAELQAQLASRDESIKQLYSRNTSLQGQVAQSAGSANQLLTLSNELKMANHQIEQYRTELAQHQGRPTNEQLAELRKQLNDSLNENGKLQLQIDDLIKSADGNSRTALYDEALSEIENLRGDNREQRYEIQRLRAELDQSTLFIKSAKDLPEPAAKLYDKLATLEKANMQQLEAAYVNIRETMKAQVIHRQTFTKGSSSVAFDREKIIQNVLEQRQDNKSFFLVVGYTSVSGTSEDDRKLACKRATTVASVVNQLKAGQQQVKAIYLGETKRFSPGKEIENQVCEIWEIKI